MGDTPLIVEEKIDKFRFKEINEATLVQNGQPASCEPLLLGITKAALTSESFISAAYRHIQTEEGQYPEIQPNMFGLDSDIDDEYSRMAAQAEELHGLVEVDGEDI